MNRFAPSPEQIAATEPALSNWVGANAGSGKTHVLTQRVARLLLDGAAPQKILCLTYTKAAAAEMQTRLFTTLGSWAMAPEADLAMTLAELSGGTEPLDNPAILAEARRLFARALETPGGLKIQTIHAFCDALLRRFPLEAGVSPRFEVADDRISGQLKSNLLSDLASAAEQGSDDAFDRVALRLTEGGIEDLADAILSRRAPFRDVDSGETLSAHFGELAHATEIDVASAALRTLDLATYSALRDVLLQMGKTAERPVGEALALASEDVADPMVRVQALISRVLTKKGDRRSSRGFPSVDVKNARAAAEAELAALSDWALETQAHLLAIRTVARTRDLYAFAQPFVAGHDDGKAALGLLDFDDLVTRAHDLLIRRDMREWVLYKLDQGIDHILVDEAQDTSPQQWAVIAAIAEEFLAGDGARAEERSLFVVGDEKQSIYSFQGAEPTAFGQMRAHFADRLESLGTPLQRPDLRTSFRSAPAILDFVDAVFAGEAAQGLTVDADPIEHRAHRKDDQGRVDLWPAIEPAEHEKDEEWWKPVDQVSPTDAKERLATCVADHIADLIAKDHLPARGGVPGRRITPGDILVLVSKRDRLAHGIIRDLKSRNVPVAGADRLLLGAELGVKDLLAAARVAITPADDLSLAALLRSPLFGVSEDELFALAYGRAGSLWHAVQDAPAHADAAAILSDIAKKADFLRPYEFLEHILTNHDGRRRLLARLGAEAEDPIDELLTQALTYERTEPPSLVGFLAWIDAGDIVVKREMDQAGGHVRVMTVHGSKGLEAPIVILPDTFSTGSGGAGRPVLLSTEAHGNTPPLMLWAGTKAEDDPLTGNARNAANDRDAAERRRLLYVALTRAEDWLILCGARPRSGGENTWYGLLEAGIERCGAALQDLPSPTGDGMMRRFETGRAPHALPDPAAPTSPEELAAEPPPWLVPAPTEVRIERGRPSALADQDTAHGGAGLGREQAMARGTAVHYLLENMAGAEASDTEAEAEALLNRAFPDLAVEIVADAAKTACEVLRMPDAATLFGPDSMAEVSVAIDPPDGGLRMLGRIDRLIPLPDRVLVIDIKSDAIPPTSPDGVATAYLAQLGAYCSAIAPVWPGLPVQPAILWTTGPVLMPLDRDRTELAFRAARFGRNTSA